MALRAPFRVLSSLHPVETCPPCARAAQSATSHASVTGSVGATWREVEDGELKHEAEVTRLSEAELARREADRIGNEFVRQLGEAFSPIMNTDALDALLADLRAAEYEAGWAAGYAQHPANADRKPLVR